MKKVLLKGMSKKMNEYGSMNAMKEGISLGGKTITPSNRVVKKTKPLMQAVSPAQQAAIAISKKEKKEELEERKLNEILPALAVGAAALGTGALAYKAGGSIYKGFQNIKKKLSSYGKRTSNPARESVEEKHVPDHQETAVNAMAMNAMKKETARKEMMVKAMKMPIRAMKTGDDDMTPDALKLNAMIKDPHKSREEDPKKDLNATYMKSDVRADVMNGGGTDMSKVQDAPKMQTAMKKINATYKTEKYHETKPGSIHDVVAQMQMNEQKLVSIKLTEFTKMVETYLLKGGVIDTSSINEEVDLDVGEEINAMPLNELREFITTYNNWFATNHRAEEFVLQVNEDPEYARITPNSPTKKPRTTGTKGSAMNFSKAAGRSSSNVKKPLMQDVSPGFDNSRRGDKPKQPNFLQKVAQGIKKHLGYVIRPQTKPNPYTGGAFDTKINMGIRKK